LLGEGRVAKALVGLLNDDRTAMLVKRRREGGFDEATKPGGAASKNDEASGAFQNTEKGASSALSIMAVSGLLESVRKEWLLLQEQTKQNKTNVTCMCVFMLTTFHFSPSRISVVSADFCSLTFFFLQVLCSSKDTTSPERFDALLHVLAKE
jgi:hypothetical protein